MKFQINAQLGTRLSEQGLKNTLISAYPIFEDIEDIVFIYVKKSKALLMIEKNKHIENEFIISEVFQGQLMLSDDIDLNVIDTTDTNEHVFVYCLHEKNLLIKTKNEIIKQAKGDLLVNTGFLTQHITEIKNI
ncbi:hypothetical protein [Bacillus cereus group sp. TH152-1LC]|uniref:hypothetical protein n=1 Tax=Bacillus cereus group sp. TH152-1LC TaxID=3018060 RepID=UPI0022E33018|nr:hypothetical protein [Bacillus cereus group sp. TH152-1LC]MDA1675111.1 hypothetical protein [Bacillus cereus group sp. TH152-1LC]